nr:F-box protein At2g02240-like isoform X2 [Erigeron canadensis]
MSICDSAKHQRTIGKLDDIVFDGIKKQIVQKSLVTFQRIAIQCLNDEIKERPTAGAILEQLQKALEYQEDIEIWKNKLPVNYIDILKLSKSPEIYFTMWKKDIYNMFTKGISLQDGKLWFSIGSNEERKEIISATTFLYKNRWSRRWQSIQISRFKKVAEMLDVANLNIHITKSTKLLLPDVKYNVHLVFKFCYPRKSHADRMYVNLKYKMGNQNLNAYFATMRNDKWLMIELCRFSNQKEETNVDILLESFTRCYCDSRAIYIEGIEFQALDNVKQEEIKKSENNEQVSKKRKFDEFSDQSFEEPPSSSVSIEVPAEQVLYDTSNKKLSLSSLSFQSRSEGEGIELPRQQVFRIKCNIGSQMGSPNTKVVVCYLVFKLSDKCRGLHCPVIVRDQSNWGQKETGILYFRSPSPWNLVATDRVPKKRGDGWMEVIVAIFNSDCRFLNLKLSTYEGTMSGLILRSLEFRPS